MFTLVRHAHAGDKKLWTLPDHLRPLSVHGRQQAEGLVETLAGMPMPRLLSSPFLRCQQTLQPLAANLGVRVEDCDLLAPHAETAALDEFLSDPALENAVLCTHGETLSALLERWQSLSTGARPFVRDAAPLAATEKGAAWIVDGVSGRRARYLPPRAASGFAQATAAE